MNQKVDFLHKIRRNYRITPSEELQKFWEEVENRKLNVDYIPFHYHRFKLFSLEQVADFAFKDIRFWFKNRGEHFLVRYYIPLATSFCLSSTVIVAAYDAAKGYIGVFLVNQRKDPIFLCSELASLLTNKEPDLSKEDFIKQHISEGVIHKFDFDQHYPPYNEDEGHQSFTDEEIVAFFNQRLTDLLKFLELVYNCTYPDYKLSVKTLKKSFKISFTNSLNPKLRTVKPEIEVPKSESHTNQIDTVISLLNRLNFQKWNENPDNKEYGLYRLGDSVVMLHTHQLCEYIRLGIVPHFANVDFPSIVYSTHPSGIEKIISYEIKFFETDEEYMAFYKQYQKEKDILSIRNLTEKEFPSIVNYFLERSDIMLSQDGYDVMKIPFEEELIEALQTSLAIKKQHNIILEEGGKAYGHCRIERFSIGGEGYLYFYDWNGMLKREKVIDGLLKMAIDYIIETYSLKTIYAEPTKEDEYRNNALKRVGFKLVKENKYVRDAWSEDKIYNLWKFDGSTYS